MMQSNVIRITIPDGNNVYTICSIQQFSIGTRCGISPSKNNRQLSINDFQFFTLDNQSATLLGHSLVYELAGATAKLAIDRLVTPSKI